MDETTSYVKYLDKLVCGLDKCIETLGKSKAETEETMNELKNDEMLENVKADKKWEELMLKFKRIQMMAVKVEMNSVLSVIRREAEKLEEWLQELKSQLKIGKGGEK